MKSNFPSLIVEQINNLTRIQNQAGCQIDPLVPSIQTVGTKTKGFIYADNNQPNTAWTIKSDYVGDSTEIVINDASVFERIDMKAILGKLQNLVISDVQYPSQPSNDRQISLDLYRVGNFVYVHGVYCHKGALSEYIFPNISVPDGFKPKTKATLRGFLWQGATLSGVIFNINPDGTVSTTGTPSYDTNRFINMFTVYEI